MFDEASLLVWGGIRADELRVLERETARELFGEWKEGRRRSRRGLWTAGPSMMTERGRRDVTADVTNRNRSRRLGLTTSQRDQRSQVRDHACPGSGVICGTDSVGRGIRHRQEETLVGLFAAPGPCALAALRCLAWTGRALLGP